MSFLDGLFEQVVPELPIAAAVVSDDAAVEAGYMYRVAVIDGSITLSVGQQSLAALAGQRFAVKIVSAPPPTPPGGTVNVTVMVAVGQIESDTGEYGAGVVLANQVAGAYREWQCDAHGTWLLTGDAL